MRIGSFAHLVCASVAVLAVATVASADPFAVSSTDVPKPVPPTGTSGTTTSTLFVAGAAGSINDVNVTIDITHTFAGDLEISISSPIGTMVLLSDNHGGAGNDYSGTTFDDASGSPISGASAPFSGTFSPDNPLSAFNGQNPNGTWTLTITDTAAGDSGTLNSWSIDGDATGPVPPTPQMGDPFDISATPPEVPQNIPTTPATIVSEIFVPGDPGDIFDLDVSVNITHTFEGDLELILTHVETGTTITLRDNVGGAANDIIETYSDGIPLDPGSTLVAGLADFEGESLGGTWRLTINDTFFGDGGVLNSWSIHGKLVAPEPTGVLLAAVGVGFVAWRRRRKKKAT